MHLHTCNFEVQSPSISHFKVFLAAGGLCVRRSLSLSSCKVNSTFGVETTAVARIFYAMPDLSWLVLRYSFITADNTIYE